MQTLYVRVLCASCDSSQCCVLHDLQFVDAGRGCKRRPYGKDIIQSRSHGCLIGNNNNNCLKSNIQCIEIRVQWTVHLGSSHMHVHAVTRVHAVTPKLVICVMYLTSI